MRILLLSRYSRLGASSRVRSFQYVPFLRANGFDIDIEPLLDDMYLRTLYEGGRSRLIRILGLYSRRLRRLLSSSRYDLIWVEHEIFPWFPAWAERVLVWKGRKYVADYDDARFHRYELHSNLLVRAGLGKKIDAVMRRASLVIAGNEYLAAHARSAGASQVECIPTAVDLERYPLPPLPRVGAPFTIGWIGSPVTAKYLDLVQPALTEFCRQTEARMVVIGARRVRAPGVPLQFLPWSEETEAKSIQSCDVGIAPLPDEPWSYGKCGYKIIQYMACGKPVITSPVGANKSIVQDGVEGLLASTQDEWVRALQELVRDPSLGVRMGQAGRLKVEREYCIQVTAPKLAKLFRAAGESASG